MGRIILRIFVHPIHIFLAMTVFALIAYAFKRWMPEGRIRQFFLHSIPQWRWKRRLRQEAQRREKELAAYDRGVYLGKRFRESRRTRE